MKAVEWLMTLAISVAPDPPPLLAMEQSIMALEQEMETYRRQLPELLAREGQYVLIAGSTVVGVYPNREDALLAGYEQFNPLGGFLVKKIEATEKPHIIPTVFRCRP